MVTLNWQENIARREWQEIESQLRSQYTGPEYALKWGEAREKLYKDYGTLTPPSTDIDRLASLRNAYAGERIFIMGNGPSLNKVPMEFLANEYTFGLNRIYLMFDQIDWRPTFFTVVDWRVAADCASEINDLQDMTFFFPERFRGLLREGSDVYWYWHNQWNSNVHEIDEQGFSHDMTKGIRGAGSVTGSAIQIAYHLGFDPIYLIGVDANYQVLPTVKQSGPDQFKDGVLLRLESTQDDDPNHFDPRYFGRGRKWHNPNVPRMLEGYEACRYGIETRERRVYNATVGGKLEVFERKDLFDVLQVPAAARPDDIQGRVKPEHAISTATANDFLVGEYTREDAVSINENSVILDLVQQETARGVMVDVGAHLGTTALPFAEIGWNVLALEPDDTNRAGLERRTRKYQRLITVDPRAVSDRTASGVPFFSSTVSSGIGTLKSFTGSHSETQNVDVTTLTRVCQEHNISQIDYLKIDVEGLELAVLRGLDWSQFEPNVILAEFEDAKSVLSGYTYHDLAQFLIHRGYHVFISEWHPIIRYGTKHHWRGLKAYPAHVASLDAWGNLIAFKEELDVSQLVSAVQRHIQDASQASATPLSASTGLSQDAVAERLYGAIPYRIVTQLRRRLPDPVKRQIQRVLSSSRSRTVLSRLHRTGRFFTTAAGLLALLVIVLQAVSLFGFPFAGTFSLFATVLLVLLLANSVMSLHSSLGQSQRRLNEMQRRTSDELKLVLTQLRDLQQLHDQVNKLQQLEPEVRSLSSGLEAERSQRIVGFARRDSEGLQARNILLITVPRSGSTWLMDMLRIHPRIHLDSSAELFRLLQVKGNRYPVHLTDLDQDGMEFELAPSVGRTITQLKSSNLYPMLEQLEAYGVEKIHPSFFMHDISQLIARLRYLNETRSMSFKPLLLVRDPEAAISSFLSYRARSNWFATMDEESILQMYLNDYNAIANLQSHPGVLVLDYAQLRSNAVETMHYIYNQLWGGRFNDAHLALARDAVELTRRDARKASPFFGEREGPLQGTPTPDDARLFEAHQSEMEAIYEQYNRIKPLDL